MVDGKRHGSKAWEGSIHPQRGNAWRLVFLQPCRVSDRQQQKIKAEITAYMIFCKVVISNNNFFKITRRLS